MGRPVVWLGKYNWRAHAHAYRARDGLRDSHEALCGFVPKGRVWEGAATTPDRKKCPACEQAATEPGGLMHEG